MEEVDRQKVMERIVLKLKDHMEFNYRGTDDLYQMYKEYDPKKEKKVNFKAFENIIKSAQVQLNADEMDIIFRHYEKPKGYIDLKHFEEEYIEGLKLLP
jgi:Ca2+-binding EF-hand superfamily protein